ncbi:ribonuclease HII [Lichenicoccus sp.]|uniref:ribonuclease HII n=1 Tax=Lichenicoccus sp. TaxID=2781899 RepID=UPI003D0A383D
MPDYTREALHGGRVAGVDEVGRGPLAGPVLAACVLFGGGVPADLAELIDDSKKLSAAERDHLATAIRACPGVEIAVAAASVGEIGTLNILHASLLAMRRAVRRLPLPPDLVLVDGNRHPGLSCAVQCVVGGDGLCLSIAAASIIAKVARDRLMARLAVRLPHYGWERNAGYATPAHRLALRALGASRHHRRSFGLVRELAALTAP